MLTEEFKEILDVSQKFATKEIGKDVLDNDLSPSTDWTKSLWRQKLTTGIMFLNTPIPG